MNKLWWACLLYPPESHRELGVCPNGLKRGKRGETKMAAVLSIASCSFWGDNAMVAFALRKSALSWTQVFGWMVLRWEKVCVDKVSVEFPLFFQVILKRVKLKVFPVFVWICRSGLFDHFVHLKKGCFDWSISGSSFLLFAVSPSGYETKSFVHRVRLDWHEFISGGKVWNST